MGKIREILRLKAEAAMSDRKIHTVIGSSRSTVQLPGDNGFVDYAGQAVPFVDRLTDEVRAAQMFIVARGCSNYTFAEATWAQVLPIPGAR